MRAITGLFGKSPFKLLAKHMEYVNKAVGTIPDLFDALYAEDYDRIKVESEKAIKFEHEADKLKDEVRSQIPNSLFMPVDRRDFMSLLSAQDDIADAVEDLSIVLRFKNVRIHDRIKPHFSELLKLVIEISEMAHKVVEDLDNLMEVSFRGPEADAVIEMTNKLGTLEWEADKLQFKIAQEIFVVEDELSKGDFYIHMELIRKLGGLADKSEKVGKILRMFIFG